MSSANLSDVKRPAAGRDDRTRTRLSLATRLRTAGVLFRLSLARYAWSRRTLIVSLLFSLPCVIVLLAIYDFDSSGSDAALRVSTWRTATEHSVVFWLIPHAFIPLTALLYASGMIQDEIEEQTLTYLLVRPVARWTIYTAKYLAVLVVTVVITSIFTTAAYIMIHWGSAGLLGEIVADRAAKTCVLFGLSLSAYCALFALVSLVFERSLLIGVAYIFVFEVVFANFEFMVRRLTVIYYFRVLARRWLDLPALGWSINLYDAPSASACVLTLLGASLAAVAMGVIVFSVREFRFKTPGGR